MRGFKGQRQEEKREKEQEKWPVRVWRMLSQEKDLVHAYHQPMTQQFTKARVTTLMRTSRAYSRTNGTEPNVNIPKANLGKGSLDIMWSGKDNTPGYNTLHLRMQHIAVCAFCLTNRKGQMPHSRGRDLGTGRMLWVRKGGSSQIMETLQDIWQLLSWPKISSVYVKDNGKTYIL